LSWWNARCKEPLQEVMMNRRLGSWIQIGLLAAVPMTWTATAFAQSADTVPKDTGINPTPQQGSDIDKGLNKAPSDTGSPDVSGSTSGSSVGSRSETQAPPSVPGQVEKKDIQKSSGSEVEHEEIQKQSGSDTGVQQPSDNLANPEQKGMGTQNQDNLKDSTDVNK
jgi:hypothetical protein